ncbi:MAG TPA: hypothetical protein PKO06_17465 [Candidatus Ozemobacteraceae bacterium]|nr:hypothetical protein [Candidatus Ozemobacteraceae bacterium]
MRIERVRAGITFVELCLAVIILAMALLPIFGLMSASNTATRQQKAEGVAANLAKEEMNRLLYVITRTNCETMQSAEIENRDVEGNVFRITKQFFFYDNTAFNVTYPEVQWHDMRQCTGGIETNMLNTATHIKTREKNLLEVTQESQMMIADVVLKIEWRLPNEADFKPTSFLNLVARRAFLVEKKATP